MGLHFSWQRPPAYLHTWTPETLTQPCNGGAQCWTAFAKPLLVHAIGTVSPTHPILYLRTYMAILNNPWVASLSSDQFSSEIYFTYIHYHLHCQCSHPLWPLAWTTIIHSKLAHCRKKCFCLLFVLNGYIWLIIWSQRTHVVWPLVTSSATSFSKIFSDFCSIHASFHSL